MESIQTTDAIRELAKSKREEWERLTRERRRIDILVERCKEYVEALNKLLGLEGLPRIELTEREAGSGSGFAKVGNKSPNMPMRRPEYEGISMPEAARLVLEDSPGPLHLDVIVERVYEIKGVADRKAAKHSFGSTLAAEAKKPNGSLRKTAPNTYEANRPRTLFDDNHSHAALGS